MKLEIDLDTAQFRAAAQDAVRKLGANAELLIKEEAKFVIRDFMKVTPPFAKGGFGRSIGSGADKKAGEDAIKKDLSSIASGAERSFLTFVVDNFGETQIKQQLFKKGTEKPYLIDWDKVSFAQEELERFHVSKRNRYGRTPSRRKGAGGAGEADRTIGRWVARERLIVPHEILSAYLKRLLARVGAEKAAFGNAARKLGINLPRWISRHAGNAQGSYAESYTPSFAITIGGKSQRPDAQKDLAEVVQKRGVILAREVKRMMKSFAETGKIMTRRKSFNQ